MSTEKSGISIIEEAFKKSENVFKQFTDVLNSVKIEMEKLENVRKQLEQEKVRLEQHEKQLEEETKKLENEKKEKDQKIGAMTEEQMRLLEEYEKVKVELKKFAQAAAEQEEAEFNFERIQALLSIFRVLVEKIWQGQSHYRILHVLHGDKEEMNREELKNATGVGGAFVLRAVQELARVDLLEYNEDTGTAKLKQRLFPKKAIKE